MAHYLLRITSDGDYAWVIVEADSAKQAADETEAVDAHIEVWTLRSDKPRIFEVTTESVRTVKRVE